MQITRKAWNNYVGRLSKLSDKASQLMTAYINKHGLPETTAQRTALLDYAVSLSDKYGEGAATLACEMYDALALLEKATVESAIPAELPTYGEVAKAVNGTMKHSQNTEVISSVVGRMVKQASADTMIQNAQRDSAEWAWVPNGDTCAFCIALASRGWQPASKAQLNGNHAEHIHSNCDCNFCIRFDSSTKVQGYDPDKYKEQYDDAEGTSSKDKINAMRRENYAKNREKILEQKASAYKKRKELESDKAEEEKA